MRTKIDDALSFIDKCSTPGFAIGVPDGVVELVDAAKLIAAAYRGELERVQHLQDNIFALCEELGFEEGDIISHDDIIMRIAEIKEGN